MFEFMLMEKQADGSIKGWGSRSFRVVPAKDDYITANDEQGIGQAFLVLAVIHPDQVTSTAGDILVKHVGTSTGLFRRIEG